ncbi:MAG: hypothetical protein A2Z14_13255 [Chloroflexi bacterium RBG_16_48_8]|nr:MAG: hypothetical protein A2Z14_13255 [Chloroflexi bacterium RBG_16_48_8]
MGLTVGEQPAYEEFDLLLIYVSPFDNEFVDLLRQVCQGAGLSLLAVCQEDADVKLRRLHTERLRPRVCLDLAAGATPSLLLVEQWASEHIRIHLNPSERRREVWRKTSLHWEFIQAGVVTPYTIPVPALVRVPDLQPPQDLWHLGVPFSAKPDIGGGGWEVVIDAQGWEDVLEMRRRLPEEDLILQELIKPNELMGKRAWFRVLYACGLVVPCWWDDRTHLFGEMVSEEERQQLGLEPLWEIAHIAAGIARLQIFSTEVAKAHGDRFVVVDYVNDPVDLRFRPHVREGMPPEAARTLAEAIAAYLKQHSTPGGSSQTSLV